MGRAVVLLAFLVAIAGSSAAQSRPREKPWVMKTRLLVTGTNRSSEPEGFTTYTAFPLEVSIGRSLGGRFALELAARSESREVDRAATPTAERLGTLELLPVSLLAQYRLGRGRVRPYLGVGGNLTVVWEKAGVLDSMEVSPSLGPALQAGVDVRLSEYLVFNADFRWNAMRTDLDAPGGPRFARLLIDAASLGVGLGVRF
ncbi:MAG: OmpW family outer membrane protein [Gemmatimonadales bacterium]